MVAEQLFTRLTVTFMIGVSGMGDYSLVYYDVPEAEIIEWIIKFVNHCSFNTRAKRMGKVIKVNPFQITYWELKDHKFKTVHWELQP